MPPVLRSAVRAGREWALVLLLALLGWCVVWGLDSFGVWPLPAKARKAMWYTMLYAYPVACIGVIVLMYRNVSRINRDYSPFQYA